MITVRVYGGETRTPEQTQENLIQAWFNTRGRTEICSATGVTENGGSLVQIPQ